VLYTQTLFSNGDVFLTKPLAIQIPPKNRPFSHKLVNSLDWPFIRYFISMAKRQLYLAAYDISCNRRLRKALYVLRGYASGGQKSVFECFLTASEKSQLLDEIAQVINPAEDRFILLRLEGVKYIRTLGKAVTPQDGTFFYVG
jgi:CRISPR-associated protein Cas2